MIFLHYLQIPIVLSNEIYLNFFAMKIVDACSYICFTLKFQLNVLHMTSYDKIAHVLVMNTSVEERATTLKLV